MPKFCGVATAGAATPFQRLKVDVKKVIINKMESNTDVYRYTGGKKEFDKNGDMKLNIIKPGKWVLNIMVIMLI